MKRFLKKWASLACKILCQRITQAPHHHPQCQCPLHALPPFLFGEFPPDGRKSSSKGSSRKFSTSFTTLFSAHLFRTCHLTARLQSLLSHSKPDIHSGVPGALDRLQQSLFQLCSSTSYSCTEGVKTDAESSEKYQGKKVGDVGPDEPKESNWRNVKGSYKGEVVGEWWMADPV